LIVRVARWKVENLTEGEVLRCATSFFRFHNLYTSEDLLLSMCKPLYGTDLLSCRPQWKIHKEVLLKYLIWVDAC
jgi:hypothetical protein